MNPVLFCRCTAVYLLEVAVQDLLIQGIEVGSTEFSVVKRLWSIPTDDSLFLENDHRTIVLALKALSYLEIPTRGGCAERRRKALELTFFPKAFE